MLAQDEEINSVVSNDVAIGLKMEIGKMNDDANRKKHLLNEMPICFPPFNVDDSNSNKR